MASTRSALQRSEMVPRGMSVGRHPRLRQLQVKFPDGRESVYFYWDDNSGRRAITQAMSNTEGFLKAKELARAEQDKWGC
jgi:hypothetical protein